MNKQYLEAAVKLALCPKGHNDSVICRKCPYTYANGRPCYTHLYDDVYKSLENPSDEPMDLNAQKLRVSDLLLKFGAPANLLGYKYLREAILMCLEDPSRLNRITEGLYVSIAQKYHTRHICVERDIRNTIERMWSRGNLDMLYDYFGEALTAEKGKVTNTQFITVVVDKFLMEDK